MLSSDGNETFTSDEQFKKPHSQIVFSDSQFISESEEQPPKLCSPILSSVGNVTLTSDEHFKKLS